MLSDHAERETGQETGIEYAVKKVELAEYRAGSGTASAAWRSGKKLAVKTCEIIKERKQGQVAAQAVKEAAAETGKASVSPGRERGIASSSFMQDKIRLKPESKELVKETKRRTVKKSPHVVKSSPVMPEKIKTQTVISKKEAVRTAKAAKQAAVKSIQASKQAVRTASTTTKGLKVMAKEAATAVKAVLGAVMAGGGAAIIVLVLMIGIIGGAAFMGNSQSAEPLSAEVLAYTSMIQKYANEYGIPEYVSSIQAIMMQESGGRGTDPMQASECPYNTKYPNSPGAIQDPEYSIKTGVQYYADCISQSDCKSPQDMEKLKLSWQGYNYGNGYISWAIRNHGGYSAENALQFSREQAASHGWSGYGDPEYVPHVMRYYSGGEFLFAGLFGNEQLVTIAKGQLGDEGGRKFWSWYGFESRVEWCACFVSWCADQAGLIQSGAVPKFALCTAGVDWFQSQGKWQSAGSMPVAGSYIFFDWDHDGKSDHVGIVESCDGTTVYTVEGNSGDMVKQNRYSVNSPSVLGYGLVIY